MPTKDQMSEVCYEKLVERTYHSELRDAAEIPPGFDFSVFEGVETNLDKPESVIMGFSGCAQDAVVI